MLNNQAIKIKGHESLKEHLFNFRISRFFKLKSFTYIIQLHAFKLQEGKPLRE